MAAKDSPLKQFEIDPISNIEFGASETFVLCVELLDP